MVFKIILIAVLSILAVITAAIVIVAVSSIFIDTSRVYDTDNAYFRFLLYFSTMVAVFAIRIKIDKEGLEKLPAGRFLLVSNHRSKFDPILTWHVMRKQKLAFISKPSNFKVPAFGRIIRKCCFMPIDRDDPLSAARTVNHAAKLMTDDQVSVAVYPEGTRNYGEGLLPFHNGLFRIAQKANVPIVVMTTRGTSSIHENFPLHRSRVKLKVLDVIPAETVKNTRTNDLGDMVREMMLCDLEGGAIQNEEKERITI